MTLWGLCYSPRGAGRILFSSLPQLPFLSPGSASLAWFTSWCLVSLSLRVQFLPFLETLCSWDSLWSRCCPGPHTAAGLGLAPVLTVTVSSPGSEASGSFALSFPFGFSRPFAGSCTGPARCSPARGLPPLSQLRVEVRAASAARPPRGVGSGVSPPRRPARLFIPPRAGGLLLSRPPPEHPRPPRLGPRVPGGRWSAATGGPCGLPRPSQPQPAGRGRAGWRRRRCRGAGNGPGLALLTGGAAAATPGRAEGGAEPRGGEAETRADTGRVRAGRGAERD